MLGVDGNPEALQRHQVLDVVKDRQGEDLMDFHGKTGMRVVYGSGERYGFTCVSGRGLSVVDYFIVGAELRVSVQLYSDHYE